MAVAKAQLRQKPAHLPPAAREPVELEQLNRQALAMMRGVDVRRPEGWKLLIVLAMRAGWTLQEIARVFPCAVSTVSRWQAGKAGPPEFVRPAMRDLLVQAVERRLDG